MWLCKDTASTMSNVLKELVNMSFCNGESSQPREVIVCPVLKKAILDKNVLQIIALFPISGTTPKSWRKLLLLSCKIMKIICAPMSFMRSSRAQHSVETALPCIKTDIMTKMDNEKAAFVVLSDLSAAFDTVGHQTLLDRLSSISIKLVWRLKGFRLTSVVGISVFPLVVIFLRRMQLMGPKCNDSTNTSSDKFVIEFGVPQDYFPLFYICVCSIQNYCINYHTYADDIQFYMAFDPKINGAGEQALSKLLSCITDIHEWMTRNMLKLNNSKTDLVLAASPYNLAKRHNVSLQIGEKKNKPLAKD